MKKITTLFALLILAFANNQAKAQVFTEDFETNWFTRWSSNGTWDVGTPTAVGPSSAHGGSMCAGTVLNGNYPDNQYGIQLIKINPITVPPANQNPRLRFWQWFSFSCGDYGRVQIKTPTNTSWVNLTSYTYANTCSGVWTVEEIDLSKWADSTVQFALYLYTVDCNGNGWDVSSGWYVDDLELRTGPYTFNYTENFENGYGDWSIDRGTWEIDTLTGSHSGTKCSGTKLVGNYDDNVDTRLKSAWVTVPSKNQNPRFRFWQSFSFSCGDYGQVQVKTKSGNWTNIGVSCANTSGSIWSVQEISLDEWADSTIQIAFYLHTTDCNGNGWDISSGWYVDDLELRTGLYAFNNTESFENGYGDWSVDRGTWEIGNPTFGPPSPGGYFSSNCAGTKLNSTYDDNVDTRLISPWMKLPSISQVPNVVYRQWYNFSSADYGKLQIRTKTSGWNDVFPNSYVSGSGTNWTTHYESLSPWADSTVQIGFYLHTLDQNGNGWDVSSGWYIDSILVNAFPVATIKGPNTVCKNAIANYTSNIGYATYNWSVIGGNIVSGQGTTHVEVKWTISGNQSISLNVTNQIYSDNKSMPVIIKSLPTSLISTGDPTSFCIPDKAILMANTGSGLSYKWQKGGVNIVGELSPSYNAIATGNYKCIVTNSSGCSKISNIIPVTANYAPSASINAAGATTFCAGGHVVLNANTGTGFTYKWKNSGIYISGATTSSFTATIAGTYKAQVSNNNGCSKTSSAIIVTVPCREEEFSKNKKGLDVFPNPSLDILNVNYYSLLNETGSVILTDATGRLVKKEEIHFTEGENQFRIEIRPFESGIYLLTVKTPSTEKIIRVVKE